MGNTASEYCQELLRALLLHDDNYKSAPEETKTSMHLNWICNDFITIYNRMPLCVITHLPACLVTWFRVQGQSLYGMNQKMLKGSCSVNQQWLSSRSHS